MTPREGRYNGFTYTETLADGITSDAIAIPPLPPGGRVTCTVIAGANTAKIQFTTSSDAAVSADTATWQDWPQGDKTGTFSDSIISPVTAVRGVSVSGEIDFEIVI
jgi:hypothetical protein